MPERQTILILYAALSLLIGGCVLTYEIWDTRLDRGKHPSPKMGTAELVFFGVFVVVLWPYLLVTMLVDVWSEKS